MTEMPKAKRARTAVKTAARPSQARQKSLKDIEIPVEITCKAPTTPKRELPPWKRDEPRIADFVAWEDVDIVIPSSSKPSMRQRPAQPSRHAQPQESQPYTNNLEEALCHYIRTFQRKKGQGFTLSHLNGPDFYHPDKPQNKRSQARLQGKLLQMPSLTRYDLNGEAAFRLKEDEFFDDVTDVDPFDESKGLLKTVSIFMHERKNELHPTCTRKQIVVSFDEWDGMLEAIDKARDLLF